MYNIKMSDTKKSKNCIIYCRVSTSKQAQQGESLDEQEKICRAVAERLGLNVLRVFKEKFSGRKETRPAIDEAFEYIKNKPHKVDIFIFRVIDRFTRNGTLGYEQLKQRLLSYNVQLIDSYGIIQPSQNTLEHLGVEYTWSQISPSETTELVMAQEGKNEVNRILTRMIGAEISLVREGYHVGPPREGFINEKIFVDGKKKPIQKADPAYAHFFIKMFELRASGAFTDQEIANQINAMGYSSRKRNRWSEDKEKIIGSTGGILLNVKHLQHIIANPIYCGINAGKWVASKPIKTRYAGLVSISMFNKANKGAKFIEETENGNIIIHKDYNPHSLKRTKDNPLFPFKSVILCPECEKPFLGSVSRGKSGAHFPFYHCSRNHKQYGINKKEFEKQIAYFINNLKYKEGFFKSFENTLMGKYREKEKELGQFSLKASNNITELEAEKMQKIEAFTSTQNKTIRIALEKQIEDIEKQINQATEQRTKLEVKEHDIKSFIKYVKYLMEHQEERLLKQENLTILRSLFGLVFDKFPTYSEIVNGTPKLSLPYKLSSNFKDSKSFMAGDEGIEPSPDLLERSVLPLN